MGVVNRDFVITALQQVIRNARNIFASKEETPEIIDITNGLTADIKAKVESSPTTLLSYNMFVYVPQVDSGSGVPTYYFCVNGAEYKELEINWSTLTIQETSINYAQLASPALTGTPTAPTAADGTNTTQIATTAFVQVAVLWEKGTGTNSVVQKGGSNVASGDYSHAEGSHTTASGENGCSHAEGYNTIASGDCSHAEGSTTRATEVQAHAEGYNTQAVGSRSHAEGDTTVAQGAHSHAEGEGTTAKGSNSHAEGQDTYTNGSNSHAEGWGTRTNYKGEHAEGRYNVSISGTTLHTVGMGTSSTRKNAHTITIDGKHYIPGIGTYQGTETTLPSGQDLATIVNSKLSESDLPTANLISQEDFDAIFSDGATQFNSSFSQSFN